MSDLFTKEAIDNCQFKWQNLAGKELLIQVGEYPDEYGKGVHVCVVGIDKSDGKCYVLYTGIERG